MDRITKQRKARADRYLSFALKRGYISEDYPGGPVANNTAEVDTQREQEIDSVLAREDFQQACNVLIEDGVIVLPEDKPRNKALRRQASKFAKGRGAAHAIVYPNKHIDDSKPVVEGDTLHVSQYAHDSGTRVTKYVDTVERITPSGIVRCKLHDLKITNKGGLKFYNSDMNDEFYPKVNVPNR